MSTRASRRAGPLPPRSVVARWLVCFALAPAACEQSSACEEDIRAQVLDEQLEVRVGALEWLAELADDPVERDRGWRHRRCAREALLLLPDAPASELPIWGCALVEPIDAVFIADGEVVSIERIEPCPDPCGGCPLAGEGLLLDAVLELPAGEADVLVPGNIANY